MVAAAIGSLGAGSALGRYELLLPIAQGGMATVWAARMKGSRGFSKIVAVKTMLPSLSKDPRFEKMFLSEAEIASRIKHPNVCEILDLGEEEGVLYLVMEWIYGESLSTLFGECERQGRKIPYSVAARIGVAASRGLHAAHELKDDTGSLFGVVHRDVSPQNILITFDGIIKIVDFGVAKAAARSEGQVTQTGHLNGKAQYMAPEQAYCDDVDRRTDIFALGVVLYQITTGTHPFRADNELAVLARITSPEPVPDPSTLAPDCPPELGAVVRRALAKDPAERYATMSALARDLEAVTVKLFGPDTLGVEVFVGDVLSGRSAEQSEALRGALREADARELSSPSAAAREKRARSSLAVVVPKEIADTLRRASGGTRIALGAGLVALGAVLGALGLLWVRSASRAAPSSAAPAPTSMWSDSAKPPTWAATSVSSGEPPPAVTSAASAESSAKASAAPSKEAPPKASAAASASKSPKPALSGSSSAAKVDSKVKFRSPDF